MYPVVRKSAANCRIGSDAVVDELSTCPVAVPTIICGVLVLGGPCRSALCLVLAPLVTAGCLSGVPALSPTADVSCPPVLSSYPPLAPRASVAWLVGGFPSPTCPRPSYPGTPSPLVVTPGVSSPWGNCATPGVLMTCRDSTPLCTPWRSPPGFSATPEASRPPSSPPTPKDSWATPEASRTPFLTPTPEDSPAGFSCQPVILPLPPGLAPRRPSAHASSAASEVAFPVSPPLAAAYPDSSPLLLS